MNNICSNKQELKHDSDTIAKDQYVNKAFLNLRWWSKC